MAERDKLTDLAAYRAADLDRQAADFRRANLMEAQTEALAKEDRAGGMAAATALDLDGGLSAVQRRTLARIYAGGVGAARTETFNAACGTIASLMRLGLLDKVGLTAAGRAWAKADNGNSF
jgi:hypothetical protein